jgi:hypothetical protein
VSDRSDDRKYPLRRLFGFGSVPLQEPCVRCNKPETNRVVLVLGNVGWHKSVLCWTGMDESLASAMVADRWANSVFPMLLDVHEICAEAGHPEWAPAPKTAEEACERKVPLSWRMCRACASKGDLATINAERLNAIIHDDAEGGMIPHVVMQKDDV